MTPHTKSKRTHYIPAIIAIAGGSGSGKTTLARKVAAALGSDQVLIISQDSYYRDQSHRFDGDGGAVNFDHPEALDFELLATHLTALKQGHGIQIPIYDFALHSRSAKSIDAKPRPFIIVDGTLILSQPPLVDLFDHGVFLDVSEALRFERRLKRDVAERGRTPEGVRKQFELQVAPMHRLFVQPSLVQAHLTVGETDDMDAWVLDFVRLLVKE